MLHHIINWLLPEKCISCHYPAQKTLPLCLACQRNLPILPETCEQCARFLPDNAYAICGACLVDPPSFQHTFALFPYDPPIKQWITQLKFHHKLFYAHALGKLMAERIAAWYHNQSLPDLVMPIPLHPQRLRKRGFNQALEIARPVAKTLALPLDYQALVRTRNTLEQSQLPAQMRKNNVADAFTLTRDCHGLHIALIDDVVTTSHTVNECAKLLKNNGAERIDVWCCARNG